MILLLAVGFLAGVVTGVSPCILPVLPILAAGGAVPGSRWRPLAIVGGMVITFSIATLAGSSLLSFLGLPQDLLRDLGIVVLFVLGASLVVPRLGELLERPFARLGARRQGTSRNGLLLGASLGVVFVPCAGPVLAAITVVAATHRISARAILVTLLYALGAAIPMLAVAYLSRGATARTRTLRERAPRLRQVAGALILASALVILLGVAQPLQKDIPGFANALDTKIEASPALSPQLRSMTGERSLKRVKSHGSELPDPTNAILTDYGNAPRLLKITAWLNTPGNRPLSVAALRGKVVLIDFWTYSCINCERTIPHLEAWYKAYARDGLVIIGVHTPEFAFERVIGNVRHAVENLGVTYPVAIDNSYDTWFAYGNEYWPTEYLIDQTGQLRYINSGEGKYSETETLIRDLLSAEHRELPPRTDVPDLTPSNSITPETYLGFALPEYVGTKIAVDKPAEYHFASVVPPNAVSLNGNWTAESEYLLAGTGAALRLRFDAADVYLVLSGKGTIAVNVGDHLVRHIRVTGYPRLYTIVREGHTTTELLQLDLSPGIQAYDFTFG